MKKAILLFSLFSSLCVYAQTTVSGGIYQDTTWTLAGSPYLLTGSVVIFPGKTLTIEPGVEILITPDFSNNPGNYLYLEVRGTLIAVGTDAYPIRFTSADSSAFVTQTWLGISVKGSQGGNIQLDRFRLEKSWYGIYNDIAEPGMTYNFTNCQFLMNNYAVQLQADMVYTDCIFSTNGVGQAAQISYGSLTATNCQFINNFCSFTWSNSINVTNSLFQGNANNIIASPGTITNCQFINNDYGLTEAYGHTIQNCYFTGNGVGIDHTGSLTLSECTFENNTTAIRVSDNSILSLNTITNNQIGIAVNGSNPSSIQISDNRICNNSEYNLKNLTDKNFQVNLNCFCSQDSNIVEVGIYDGYDDITKGLVNYAIYDDSCENILTYVTKIMLDISEIPNEINVFAFDNELHINTNNFNQISICNVLGQHFLNETILPGITILNLDFPNGIYLLSDQHGNQFKFFIGE
jgi:hypothetical protein